MQFPISLGLHRSTLLTVVLVLVHGLAAASCALLPWPLLWRAVVWALLAWSLAHAVHTQFSSAIVGLRLVARDRIECQLIDGRSVPARVFPDSTVFFSLIVLRLALEGERRVRALTVLPDQLDAAGRRRLRLWLRWQVEPSQDFRNV